MTLLGLSNKRDGETQPVAVLSPARYSILNRESANGYFCKDVNHNIILKRVKYSDFEFNLGKCLMVLKQNDFHLV